jgi:H+/Cl- antiporter ClcA
VRKHAHGTRSSERRICSALTVHRGRTNARRKDRRAEALPRIRHALRAHLSKIAIRGHTFIASFLSVPLSSRLSARMYGHDDVRRTVSQGVETLFAYKVETVLELIEHGHTAEGYFVFLGLSLLFVLTAAGLVSVIAPFARGGGVPYVLAYLNGTNVMEYFSWRIVVVKTLSLVFTIAGGLTLGMEGPFVFIGGGVAAILSAALDVAFPFFPRSSAYSRIIRGIREERIFMAGGMAAGLAVAFDAPIAGVLFALEGATAFLSAPVVLRIFGCAMFASFFNDLGHTNFSRYIRNHNLLEVSNSGEPSEYAWTLVEIFPFAVIGLVGGVVGAMVRGRKRTGRGSGCV